MPIIYYLVLFIPLSGLCGELYGTDIPYNPHEVLVKFEQGTDEATKISIREGLGAIVLKTIRSIKVEYWQLPDTITTAEALELLKGLPAVDHAEPNYLYSLQMLPNDAHFNKQWFLHCSRRIPAESSWSATGNRYARPRQGSAGR